ncbi:MAG: allophanate hydrolase [Planctomycetes bacterium]|nr:allophanate hydrolase [Planctomycetota bacterium]
MTKLRAAYDARAIDPREVVEEVLARIGRHDQPQAWIHRVSQDILRRRAAELSAIAGEARKALPLYGVPFAVKDNIDVAGVPTTAGCPAYAYTPSATAFAVQRLLEAGAIFVGKTNMDAFATGLVGTRSPYGACHSVYHRDYISGGSSSGSAVVTADELVTFALGTDTAGSGRVPAAFNGLIGLKPTRGRISMRGVVPACRSLDCVSIFTKHAGDAERVLDVVGAYDEADAYARWTPMLTRATGAFRFGILRENQREFFGDSAAAAMYEKAIARCVELGGEAVEFDYEPLHLAARLLYGGPWVAERYAAIAKFFDADAADIDETVRTIIGKAKEIRADEAFGAMYLLEELRGQCAKVWEVADVLMLPTAPTMYRIEEVKAEPIKLNTNLGHYTNFMNLLDWCGVATPAGLRADGLPFGVTFIGRAWSEATLLDLARRFAGEAEAAVRPLARPREMVKLVVVGAHLSGMPLNWQLMSRGAKLIASCRTAAAYRLYALANSKPAKPALVHVGKSGAAIEVEVWTMSVEAFGSFVDDVPGPLAIGTVTLDDGGAVHGFVAEPRALDGAIDITHFRGWRAYVKQGGGT